MLDESGLVGTRQMEELVSHVKKAKAKLVLVGDAERLQAIEAGAFFRLIWIFHSYRCSGPLPFL